MRKLGVLLAMICLVFVTGWAFQPPSAIGAHESKKVCKTVTKIVHGKKKKVKVCHKVAVKVRPTNTPTAVPTATPTATATATNTPMPTSTPEPTIAVMIDPASFAIPLAEFGPGAQMQVSQVEPTSDADDPNRKAIILHYGSMSWASEGRVTGFYEQVLLPITDSAGLTHYGEVIYHVSVFGTDAEATAAWQAQRNGWLLVDASKGYCGGPLGDPGYSCADSSLLPDGNVGEGYFKRGRILSQVIHYNSYNDFENYFFSVVDPTVTVAGHIAQLLKARAGSTPGNAVLTHESRTLQRPAFDWWLMHSVWNESTLIHSSIQSRLLARAVTEANRHADRNAQIQQSTVRQDPNNYAAL